MVSAKTRRRFAPVHSVYLMSSCHCRSKALFCTKSARSQPYHLYLWDTVFHVFHRVPYMSSRCGFRVPIGNTDHSELCHKVVLRVHSTLSLLQRPAGSSRCAIKSGATPSSKVLFVCLFLPVCSMDGPAMFSRYSRYIFMRTPLKRDSVSRKPYRSTAYCLINL